MQFNEFVENLEYDIECFKEAEKDYNDTDLSYMEWYLEYFISIGALRFESISALVIDTKILLDTITY